MPKYHVEPSGNKYFPYRVLETDDAGTVHNRGIYSTHGEAEGVAKRRTRAFERRQQKEAKKLRDAEALAKAKREYDAEQWAQQTVIENERIRVREGQASSEVRKHWWFGEPREGEE